MGFDSLLLKSLSLLSWANLSGKDMSEDFIDTSGVEAVKWLPLANGYTNVLSIILNDLCIFILLIKTNKKRLVTKNHNPPYMRKTRSIPTTNQLSVENGREGAINPPPAGWRQPLSSLLNRWRLAHDTGEFCERLREKCMKNGSIIHQINRELQSQLRIGEKKREAKAAEQTNHPQGIFSFRTLEVYTEQCCRFAKWGKEEHGCRTLEELRQFVPEYIRREIERGLSAWTVRTEVAAISKLYQVPTTSWGISLPSRKREDIIRSRGAAARDAHFSEKKNADLVAFLRGSGLRRSEAEAVRPCDIHSSGAGVFVEVRKGKGGKARTVTVTQAAQALVVSYQGEGQRAIWGKIESSCDVHSYRREYAAARYAELARDPHTLPPNERYLCRGSRRGEVYDRAALAQVSQDLGHNRLEVVVTNYLGN